MERMPVIGSDNQFFTPHEKWWNGHDYPWYAAAERFALSNLGSGAGRRCLVVGSPTREAAELEAAGWDVCYLDVRKPPRSEYVVGDATRLPFADRVFDAVSSTCVLCHVGLGRYGDRALVNGDAVALKEMSRVMKRGGKVAAMLGPTIPRMKCSLLYGNEHRIYQPDEAVAMAAAVGLNCLKVDFWESAIPSTKTEIAYGYLSLLMEKSQ